MPPTTMPELDARRRTVIFCFLMLSMFMATLDTHVVSTALPTIIGEFGAIERFGWIGSAYLLTQSTIMPVYGKLGDLFGRKYVMMSAVALFTLGSLACGMAWSMDSLIAARMLQGLGAGGIMVSIFSINADMFAPRQRARYQSFSSLVLMASGSVGPALGGAMSEHFGWRSIFLINLPVGIAALTGLALLLPHWRPDRKPKIDYPGAATLAVAIAGVVLWADARSLLGGMFTPVALLLPAASALALWLWLRIERRAPEPIIPLPLFGQRNFALLLIISVCTGGTAIGLVNYHALFLQMTTGLSPSAAGLFFIAVTGGIALGSLSAGRLIEKTGVYKPRLVCGLSLSACCLAGLALLPLHAPFWPMAGLLLGQGVAIGLGQQAPVIGVQIAAPARDTGAATGSVTLARMGGASLAISVYGALLAAQLGAHALPGLGAVAELPREQIAALSPALRDAAAGAFNDAFTWVYTAAVVLVLIGLAAALALKPVVLAPARKPGGAQPDAVLAQR